jgi:hypothetical protein
MECACRRRSGPLLSANARVEVLTDMSSATLTVVAAKLAIPLAATVRSAKRPLDDRSARSRAGSSVSVRITPTRSEVFAAHEPGRFERLEVMMSHSLAAPARAVRGCGVFQEI